MTAIGPLDHELLDFLCACVHHRVRIKAIKATRRASLRRLRLVGMVSWEGYQPSGSAFDNWRARQETRSEAGPPRTASKEPPAPKVAETRGGGDARKLMPPPNRGPSGSDLAAELDAYVEAHGLAKSAVGMRLFKNTNGVEVLRRSTRPRPVTIEKVRAFLAADPPPELKRHQGVGPARATKPEAPLGDRRYAANRQQPAPIPSAGPADPVDPPASPTVESVAAPVDSPDPRPALEQSPPTVDIKVNGPSGAELAALLDTFIAETGAGKTRVGLHLFKRTQGVEDLRRSARPTAPIVERVQSFLRNPPNPAELALRRRGFQRGNQYAGARTQKHSDAIRRAAIRKAQDRIDKGLPANLDNGVQVKICQEALLRQIADRERLADPIEQAKIVLRRRYTPVVGAEFADPPGPKGKFLVGRRLVNEAELLKMATGLGS